MRIRFSQSQLLAKAGVVVAALAVAALTAGCDSTAPPVGTARIVVPSQGTIRVEGDFENADAWQAVDGTWTTDKSGNGSVLKQTATDCRFPVTLLREPAFNELDVSVEFRPITGEQDASGGIVFRALDGHNYYVVRANSLEDNFRLYATVAGSRRQIASTRITAPKLKQWHTLRVVAVGDHIQASLNGALLIDHHDSRFASGRVGLWTKADAVTEFSNLIVRGVVDE